MLIFNFEFCIAKLKEFYCSRPPWRQGKEMLVNGCDCLIVIKTQYRETGVPYAVEALQEAAKVYVWKEGFG